MPIGDDFITASIHGFANWRTDMLGPKHTAIQCTSVSAKWFFLLCELCARLAVCERVSVLYALELSTSRHFACPYPYRENKISPVPDRHPTIDNQNPAF